MPINKESLELRRKHAQHRPDFVRQESWRYVRLAKNWRKPKGIDNHQRKQKKGWPALVRIGYGGPRVAKGLHPSGYTDNLVYNVKGLERLDPKIDGIRFGHGVGKKKRLEIIARAKEMNFKVFNARVSTSGSKS
ncbi:MAG: 50S ribosomal protein L32e [Thaumarchaeota archaeon]|nr:MAG: 50S ribosomal protein L32e [Nitrososphaerota archaeon]